VLGVFLIYTCILDPSAPRAQEYSNIKLIFLLSCCVLNFDRKPSIDLLHGRIFARICYSSGDCSVVITEAIAMVRSAGFRLGMLIDQYTASTVMPGTIGCEAGDSS
jgi:hypothetical protein